MTPMRPSTRHPRGAGAGRRRIADLCRSALIPSLLPAVARGLATLDIATCHQRVVISDGAWFAPSTQRIVPVGLRGRLPALAIRDTRRLGSAVRRRSVPAGPRFQSDLNPVASAVGKGR